MLVSLSFNLKTQRIKSVLLRSIRIAIFWLGVVFAATSSASQEEISLKKYIEKVADQAYQIVADQNLGAKQIHSQIAKLIRDNLYLDWMAKSSLGRYRRTISAAKLTEFTKTYSDYIVNIYADLFINYNNQKVKLRSIRKVANNMFLVEMNLIDNGGDYSNFRIEYLVHQLTENNKISYKIGDIIASGISILNSQQAEFSSVIAREGIDSLIKNLKSKTNY